MESAEAGMSVPENSKPTEFASVIVFDTESTGLDARFSRITELCMLSVLTGELNSSCTPRVINKLVLCVNPQCAISAGASRLTGLFNDSLEYMAPFSDQVNVISSFLSSQPRPLCLIAHNGNRFDFPLLKAELNKAGQSFPADLKVWCADSLEAFRVLDDLPAVPEWCMQIEKEKNNQKQACFNNENKIGDANRSGANGEKCLQETVESKITCTSSSKNEKSDVEDQQSLNRASKRQAENIDLSSKHAKVKLENAEGEQSQAFSFDSQQSVTDSELAEAYDHAIGQTSDVNGRVSPLASTTTFEPLSRGEKTPETSVSKRFGANLETMFMKKQQEASFRVADREKISRRLFDEEPLSKDSILPVAGNSFTAFKEKVNENSITAFAEISVSSTFNLPGEPNTKFPYATRKTKFEPVACQPTSPTDAKATLAAACIPHLKSQDGDQDGSLIVSSSVQSNTFTAADKETAFAQSHISPSQGKNLSDTVTTSTPVSWVNSNVKPSSGKKVSYKLPQIYLREFGHYPEAAHNAEDDCVTLLKIITRKGPPFLRYIEAHSVEFSSVEPMS